MNSLDLEFLATSTEPHRYPLEKNGHGRKQRARKKRGGKATLFRRAFIGMGPHEADSLSRTAPRLSNFTVGGK